MERRNVELNQGEGGETRHPNLLLQFNICRRLIQGRASTLYVFVSRCVVQICGISSWCVSSVWKCTRKHISFDFFLVFLMQSVTDVLPGRGRCKRIDNKHVRFNQKK